MEMSPEIPVNGLRLSDGSLTKGAKRFKRTLRIRNVIVARALELSGKRVLDIGCDIGLNALYMAESAAEVVGIDQRPDAIACAEANRKTLDIKNVTFITGDIRDNAILNVLSKFDLVVAWGLLHRITDIFSFLYRIAPITDALSVEWRTPVFPLMSKFNIAYHSPIGDRLDEWNIGSNTYKSVNDNIDRKPRKIEGDTGFWEITPAALITIMKRLGFIEHKLLGYDDNFNSQNYTIRKLWMKHVARMVAGRPIVHTLPRSRVHMLFEREQGNIKLSELDISSITIPEWDDELKNIIRNRISKGK